MKLIFTFILLFLIATPTFAATNWNIIPKKSSIKFIASQNNSPVAGEFKSFSGKVDFDPKNLPSSSVSIIIDMNSLWASYNDMVVSLKNEDWFSVKIFPKAFFEAKKFTKISDKNYKAEGKLTIRDKTVPITLNFVLEEYSDKNAKAIGWTIIKRNDFGVGQKDWAKTDSVKNEVKVEFIIGVKNANSKIRN